MSSRSFILILWLAACGNASGQSCLKAILAVEPKWVQVAGFSDAQGLLDGEFTMELGWFAIKSCPSYGVSDDVRNVIVAENFAGLTSARIMSDVVESTIARFPFQASVTYMGEWHQGSQGSCYPWDVQNFAFNLVIPRPASRFRKFKLFCAVESEDCQGYVTAENGTLTATGPNALAERIVQGNMDGVIAKRFRWSQLVCNVNQDEGQINCNITAVRDDSKGFMINFVPGILMVIIGTGSFFIPANMPMPRIAATMIALLTFVNKGSVVFANTPSSGFTFLEFFYIAGMLSMGLNMVGHILCFRFPARSHLVDTLALNGTSQGFFLVCAVYVHKLECSRLSGVITGLLVTFFTLALIGSLLRLFLKARTKAKLEDPPEVDPDHDM